MKLGQVTEECNLQQVRWESLIAGSRDKFCAPGERGYRVWEAKTLLTHTFNMGIEDCMQALIQDYEVSKWYSFYFCIT